jgi:hypothetical protein
MTRFPSPPTIEPPSTAATELMVLESTSALQFPDIPHVFDIQSTADDALDTPSLDAWTSYLRAQQRQANTARVIVRASSVQGAASGLWSAIMALANNKGLLAMDVGCHIDHFMLEVIMNGGLQIYVYGVPSLFSA